MHLYSRQALKQYTYTAAAQEDDEESLEPACSTHYPRQTDKQDHTKYVLDTREVYAK